MRQYIDLHTHSTASDGTVSPGELPALAVGNNVVALALTDHDSIAGLGEAAARAERLGLEFIRGCELSCTAHYGEVHILGLWLPEYIPEFEQGLALLRGRRQRRNQRMADLLKSLGMPIDLAEFPQGLNSLGRPHIARLLLHQGHVRSIQEAFERFLGKGRPAYIPKEDFSPAEAVKLLGQTRALVVLAHPLLIQAPKDALRGQLETLLQELVPLGLDGLEAYHSAYSNADVRLALELADKYKLLISGGSDFHGENKPGVSLGKGFGDLCVPCSVLDKLKARVKEKQGGTHAPAATDTSKPHGRGFDVKSELYHRQE
jgi:predicted metal-dependent phosphoesterase TrpH